MNEHFKYNSHVGTEKTVHIFEPDFETCGALGLLFRLYGLRATTSNSAEEFISNIGRSRTDAAIIDLDHTSSLHILQQLKSLHQSAAAIMITSGRNIALTVKAMRLGAEQVLPKPIDIQQILNAVNSAIATSRRSESPFDYERRTQPTGISALTPRERQVLDLLMNGETNKTAGKVLGISHRTIEIHRARIMDKFGVRNAIELTRAVLGKEQ